MGDTIEIWSNDKGDEPFMNPDMFGKALQEIMNSSNDNTPNKVENR